ncbi:unnamed protein product [Aphanomyces euteiches]|uniref:Serine aminopeptidase S33 domain-containing protein n=1 Tax=Aphanomyces euteiches TaxID=100861 RepID=A0A6G0WD35_9STRA|nr:hypothetical protein Ae201684_016246 [Aphanomyces euteiches]KAH9095317.1 hypothetical protein Ae201684P_013433 [Aphanomyces euteiches]KAH9147934.1 hypothetical protein AeRB84_008552 [Aphanomyces euteiches]
MLESLLTVSTIDIAGRAALLFLSFQAAWKLSSWADPRNEFHRTKENSFDPHSAAGHRQYRFNADRKLWLRTRWWLPPASTEWKGVIFIVHGYNEHIERYHYCGTKLAENGYAVFGIDHQGHGLSEGERLYVERFEHYEHDYIEFVRDTLALTSDSAHVKESMMHFPDGLKLASLPRFLLGHSMGSLISLQLIHNHSELQWNGAIMCSGAFQVDPKAISPIEMALSSILSVVLPKFRPPNPSLSVVKDRSEHERSLRDSFNYKTGPTMRWAGEFIEAMKRAPALMPSIHTPLLIFHGENDAVTPLAGSKTLYEKASSSVKELRLMPNMFHELIHDSCRDDMLDEIITWCDQRRDIL